MKTCKTKQQKKTLYLKPKVENKVKFELPKRALLADSLRCIMSLVTFHGRNQAEEQNWRPTAGLSLIQGADLASLNKAFHLVFYFGN